MHGNDAADASFGVFSLELDMAFLESNFGPIEALNFSVPQARKSAKRQEWNYLSLGCCQQFGHFGACENLDMPGISVASSTGVTPG